MPPPLKNVNALGHLLWLENEQYKIIYNIGKEQTIFFIIIISRYLDTSGYSI